MVGEKRGKKKEKKKKRRRRSGVRGWWGKKRKKKRKKNNNNIMLKTKSKNQNYVPNTIFFLNCDFSCETKTMYQTEFFLQS
jgi:hypothetical protein